MLNTLKHFWFLLFDLEKLVSEAKGHTPEVEVQKLRTSLTILQKRVFRAFKMTFMAICWAGVLAAGLSFLMRNLLEIHVPHVLLLLMKVGGYFFILWGVLSPVGRAIETWDGETLPEILDEE